MRHSFAYNIVTYKDKLYDKLCIYSIVILECFYVGVITFYGENSTNFQTRKTSKTFWILDVAF